MINIEIFTKIDLYHYLILSAILFGIGLIGILISRNLIRIVMSSFIITTAVLINFLAFGVYSSKSLTMSNTFNAFILPIATIQIIIALVMLYKINLTNEYLDIEKIKEKDD